jgi:3-hydroxyacyl-CoA dehydrogenase/enoyl-CoA hydratase/3-hydroxybutyryl-CoA epimerase/enoyl-CoA isomerase
MIYKNSVWSCHEEEGIAHLVIDNQNGPNVFNAVALKELEEAVTKIEEQKGLKGLLLYSKKDHFIFGADITEFLGHFEKSDEDFKGWLGKTNSLFNRIEDLNFPTLTFINGFALGGGLEVCLCTDYRVATPGTKVGLPETKLGLIPGWGGTVRLSRISGVDNAIEWISSGGQFPVSAGQAIGLIDGVLSEQSTPEVQGVKFLKEIIAGKFDWQAKKAIKKNVTKLNKTEFYLASEGSKAFVAAQAGPHYPAPVNGVKAISEGANLDRDEALKIETQYFVKCIRSKACANLIQVFLGDQYLKKKAKKYSKNANKVSKAGVLGAGIMGGGIAYQSASRGVPIVMKDIQQDALNLGMKEAIGLLEKGVQRGKIKPHKLAATIANITPVLEMGELKGVDFITEAIVENLEIKKKVLAQLEKDCSDQTIIASNTSTLRIDDMASVLKHPEKFCGLHFFNPVHRMPLVEVVRGSKTNDQTIALAVSYSLQLGKTPIVVNDCSGFLVNRVLFPYFLGLIKLLEEGADFRKIDKVMEKFGWPMGPAYLLDVVGLDTAEHCTHVIGGAYAERMSFPKENAISKLFAKKYFGQKNSKGFYAYELDRKGKIKKTFKDEVFEIIGKPSKDFSDEEIINRMMIPMIFESARTIEEKIVDSAIEVDMGILYGLGFPAFRMGPLKYADDFGLAKLLEISESYKNLGESYTAPKNLKEMAQTNKTFY